MPLIEELTNKQKTNQAIKDTIIDGILNDDYELKQAIKKRDVNLVVRKQERISFEYDSATCQFYAMIPETYHEKNIREMLIAVSSVINYIRKEPKAILLATEMLDDLADNGVDVTDLEFEDYECIEYKPKEKKEEEKESSSRGSEYGMTEEDTIKIGEFSSEYRYEDVDSKIDYSERESNPDSKSFYFKDSKVDDIYKVISKKLVKYFKGKNNKVSSSNPSNRLSKRMHDSNPNMYLTKSIDTGKFIKNITFIVDGSGSMSGTPEQNARIIVEAFSELAREGFCSGNVIISKGFGSFKIDLKERKISDYIHCDDGSEGIEKTMREHLDTLKDSSIIFCITDGCITDSPVNKKFYQSKGIQTIGIYVNDKATNPEEYNGALKKWFDYSICRKNVEECVNSIIQLGLRNK